MKSFNFVLFLLLITTSFLMAGFLKIASSPSTGFAVAQIENNKYLVTSQLIPAVRDGNNEISSTVRSFSNNRPADYTCVFNYSTLRYITTNTDEPYQIPLDFSTYDAITRTFTSGMSNYYCRVGNWYREDQGVIVTSEINRIAYSAFCPDSNYCVDSARQCITISGQTTIGANTFTCTNDAQWRQNQIEQPPVPENQLVDSEDETTQTVAPENEANGRVRTQSYVPGEARDRPPVRQGECPQEGMCIALDGSCHLVNAVRGGVTCAQDGNWKKYVQSYVPGESRLNPPARQGLCDGESQCIALDGSCHSPGELRGQLMCAEYNTWKGCRGNRHSININHPSAIEEEYYSELDVAPTMNYICKNNQWTPLTCTPTRNIAVDVILDTAYPSNNDVTEGAIRNTIDRMTKYLCSQTAPNGIGFTIRRIIRDNYNKISGPRTAAFDAALTSTYPQGDYPQYVIFVGNLNYSAGAVYGVMMTNQNYCNSIPPAHGEGNVAAGTNSFVTTVARLDKDLFGDELSNGHTNYGGYYGAALLVHELLHAYTFNNHYGSAGCINYINTLGAGDRKNTVVGICPDALINIVNARAECSGSRNDNNLPVVRSVAQSIAETRVDVDYTLRDAPSLKKADSAQKIISRTKPTAATSQIKVVRKPNDFIAKSSESPSNPVGDFVTWIKNLFGAK